MALRCILALLGYLGCMAVKNFGIYEKLRNDCAQLLTKINVVLCISKRQKFLILFPVALIKDQISPVATGGFGGLSPPKQSSQTP